MFLREELRKESYAQRNRKPLDREAAADIAAEFTKRWEQLWADSLMAAARIGERRLALSYGFIGDAISPFKRKSLEAFLVRHGLTYELGTSHYVVESEGEWQVEGYMLVTW